MRTLEIAPHAAAELASVLAHSEARFGPAATERYRELIKAALNDLREDPERPGARQVEGRSLYHIRHSRSRLYGPKVAAPRHFLAYRFTEDRVVLLGVLHDAMDLPTRLTDDA